MGRGGVTTVAIAPPPPHFNRARENGRRVNAAFVFMVRRRVRGEKGREPFGRIDKKRFSRGCVRNDGAAETALFV